MTSLLVATFVIAYAAIALEHPLAINKSATALIAAGLLWTIYAVASGGASHVAAELGESLMGTAQIVFFLIGAMTIVEVVDAHDGFDVITSRIKTARLSTLMWLVGMVTFFLSAILDNLTTTIVMVSLMKKLLNQRSDRLFFAGIIAVRAASPKRPPRRAKISLRASLSVAASSPASPRISGSADAAAIHPCMRPPAPMSEQPATPRVSRRS